jgi:RNA polymerase sigma-70 factor (ECF subfamily)
MRRLEDVIDEMLVLRCQRGDAGAFDVLVRRWHPRLLGLTIRLIGERDAAADVAQEAWLAIVRGLHGLDDPAAFRPWALRIAANKCRDWIRRKQRSRRRLRGHARCAESLAAEVMASGEAADEPVSSLRAAIATLPLDRQALLSMFYVQQLPVAEIAAVLGVPEGTVKSRLFHARRKLRATLEDASHAQN